MDAGTVILILSILIVIMIPIFYVMYVYNVISSFNPFNSVFNPELKKDQLCALGGFDNCPTGTSCLDTGSGYKCVEPISLNSGDCCWDISSHARSCSRCPNGKKTATSCWGTGTTNSGTYKCK